MKNTMEVLVLVDFEGTMSDELTVRMGDVIKDVSQSAEEGWLSGELRGKRGVFPANFVKEIPAYLRGDSQRVPRSIRTTKKMKQTRKCEVTYAYKPMNEDELELVPGEVIEIIKEIEDGWWMGVKNGKVGAFPSNFVKEIFVSPKEKYGEGKTRPKLSDAVFTKNGAQKASVRNKGRKTECCQVLFDYAAQAEDELNLKKGDVVTIIRKETEDEGWWEGQLDGRCGFFPDNFVMLLPPMDNLQSGNTSQPPARSIRRKVPEKDEPSAMEKTGPVKTKDDKPEQKDLRSNPPTKVKLPLFNKPSPPPVKDKPIKALPKTSDDATPPSPKQPEQKEGDEFDGVEVQTEKLHHPTANRAKPPQRRPPTALATSALDTSDQTEPEQSPKKLQTDKLSGFQKVGDGLFPFPVKPESQFKTPPPPRPELPKAVAESKTVTHKDEATVESLQAELRELKMALDLFQTRHERDMQEVKEELKEERSKRLALQDEVQSLRMKL
ncbi:SH3 domain-containing protein 21 isoform X2 [Salarias fasciatus]|uniref:SH3 domain-containing protein 21 isoform X2 n=1 Tax=Salarias fasciatus TaxID=181472 RepID=UPI001177046B|nr:SH3 domain-containing protein 21 isoform X2 [Salarias fasciatus]